MKKITIILFLILSLAGCSNEKQYQEILKQYSKAYYEKYMIGNENIKEAEITLEMHKKGLKMKYPIDGSMGDAERDCAPVMVFLASDASRYINGQIICVNGGAYMVR